MSAVCDADAPHGPRKSAATCDSQCRHRRLARTLPISVATSAARGNGAWLKPHECKSCVGSHCSRHSRRHFSYRVRRAPRPGIIAWPRSRQMESASSTCIRPAWPQSAHGRRRRPRCTAGALETGGTRRTGSCPASGTTATAGARPRRRRARMSAGDEGDAASGPRLSW